MNLLLNFHLAVIQYLYRGCRAVPIQTFGCSPAPDLTGGANSAPPEPTAEFMGATSKGKERKKDGGGGKRWGQKR